MDAGAILEAARTRGASFADARVETVEEQRLQLQDGEVRNAVAGVETGFALRVLVQGAWGFAASNDVSGPAWSRALDDAFALARACGAADRRVRLAPVAPAKATTIWRPRQDPRKVPVETKQRLLRDMDAAVRTLPEIAHVTTAYSDQTLSKSYRSTEGAAIDWQATRTVAQVHFVAKRGADMQGRHTRVGATKGWETFKDEDPVEKALAAAKSTVAALGAPHAKGGRQTVVIDHELAGVFAHEAVGHAAEADLVSAGESCFQGKLGERIGVEGLTIRDDPTLPGAFGSFPFDDNGVPTGDRVLVRDGVLVGYLADRQHAAELGVPANGAARAQDFSHRPLVRMGNTLIDAGDVPEDEVFAGIRDGVFCKGSRGGQVDTARGTYLFNAQEAYRIQDGEVTTPLRDVSLTGEVLGTLLRIEALGGTRRLGDPGYCGKGQWVPVCDGGPLVRIAECLVGGAA